MHLLQFFFLLSGIPAAEPLKFNAENIQDLAGHMVYHILDRFRKVVISLHRRHDDSSHLGQGQHVAQMDGVEGRFPGYQHQLPAFF